MAALMLGWSASNVLGEVLARDASPEANDAWLDALAASASDDDSLAPAWQEALTLRRAYLNALEKSIAHYESAFQDAREAILKAHGLPQGLDPWAGLEQELPFTPEARSVLRQDGSVSTLPLVSAMAAPLPAHTRMAEQLGLGKHTFIYTHTYIDPELKSRMPYGFAVACRMTFQLQGTFHLNDAPESVLPLYTFRLPTRSRYEVIGFNYGSGVKPHKRGLGNFQLSPADIENAWKKERLSKRLFTTGEGSSLLRGSDEKAVALHLKKLLEECLAQLRQEITASLHTSLQAHSKLFHALDTSRQAWLDQLSSSNTDTAQSALSAVLWSGARFLEASGPVILHEDLPLLHAQGHQTALCLVAAMIDRALSAQRSQLARQWLGALTSHSLRPGHAR